KLLRKRREVTWMEPLCLSVLDPSELGDHRIGALLEARFASRRVHQRERRQVVADRVAAKLNVRRFPAAQRFCGRRKTGVHTEIVKEPVGIQAEEELLVEEHCLFEWSVEQPDLLKRKWRRRERRPVGHARRDGGKSDAREDSGNNSHHNLTSIGFPEKVTSRAEDAPAICTRMRRSSGARILDPSASRRSRRRCRSLHKSSRPIQSPR